MVELMRKRKAADQPVAYEKRQRIVPEFSSAGHQLDAEYDDDDDDEYREDTAEFSDDNNNAATPATPLSPARKKFPSELNTLKCTWEGCTRTFNRPIRLQNHLKVHSNERTFTCKYEGCDKAYFEDKHLQAHIKGSHTHERKYQCDWDGCGKCFLTSTRLNRHIDTHKGHDRFRCDGYPPCNQSFRKHQTLQRHIRSDHLELAPYPCTYQDPITKIQCNAGFDGSVGLRKHYERVHGDDHFFCTECTVPFSYREDGSPANLGFTTSAQLQTHMRKAHSNSSCLFCDIRCSSTRELQKHIDSQHSGKTLDQRKQVICTHDGCGKSFTRKSNLTTHIKTAHLGERFICGEFDTSAVLELANFGPEDGCEAAFVSKMNLVDHIRTAHLELPSIVNSNRTIKFKAEEDVEERIVAGSKRKERKAGKRKATAIEQLLGEQNTFSSSYHSRDLESVMDDFQPIPGYPTDDPSLNYAHSSTELADDFFATRGYPLPEQLQEQHESGALHVPQAQDDNDWEFRSEIVEGGPFWIGADGPERDEKAGDDWTREEREMRKLIDAEEEGFGRQARS